MSYLLICLMRLLVGLPLDDFHIRKQIRRRSNGPQKLDTRHQIRGANGTFQHILGQAKVPMGRFLEAVHGITPRLGPPRMEALNGVLSLVGADGTGLQLCVEKYLGGLRGI